MDTRTYLRRLDYAGPLEASLETLRSLHYAHLLAVPFENLDIHIGAPIVLDEQRLYEKIVNRRRGGFCYELNSLFAGLLRELGFQVTLLSARVPVAENQTGPEFDHLALRVDLDTPWLADVGFGESFIEPLPLLPNAAQFQRYAYYSLDEHEGRWRVLRYAPEAEPRGVPAGDGAEYEWRMLYDFTMTPRQMSEFEPMCRHHQTSPDSHFTRRKVCSRLTPTGRITLTDTRLVITEGTERRESTLPDQAAYDAALREHFGISIPHSQATTQVG